MSFEGKTLRIKIDKRELAPFKYILESYENLVILSTLVPDEGIIEIYMPGGNSSEAMKVLESLKSEFSFEMLPS